MYNLLFTAIATATINTNRMLIGLLVGVVLLIVMVTMTKIHAFLALILTCMIVALVGGAPIGSIPKYITDGFGSTLGSIGIIIGFGVIMGQIFEVSGAAEKMARTFIKLFGKGREAWALALTGFIVSIPVFCDSAFVILFPITKALSERTRHNIVAIAGALAVGLVTTHTMVPPTPGPLAVASGFGIGIGTMILWGILVSIPIAIAGVLYIKWVGRSLVILPDEHGNLVKVDPKERNSGAFVHAEEAHRDDRDLPSVFMSFAPIVIPIILILIAQIVSATYANVYKAQIAAAAAAKATYVYPFWYNLIAFLGNPITAVAIGVLISIYGLAPHMERNKALSYMDDGIRSAGIILLVTGAGGALGNVVKVTGVGTVIATKITEWGVPAILLPFLIATIVRFIQGSGTVALVTSASIAGPIIAGTNASPVFAALAAATGGLFFSYFNDSYFHVVNRSMNNRDSKDQMKLWSGATTACWLAGLIVVLILNAIFGNTVRR